MAITFNDRRRPAAAGLLRREEGDMTNPDQIMVRPTSTYFDQGERRSDGDEPYRVMRAHGEELKALGIAEVVEEPVAVEPQPAPEAGPADEPTATISTAKSRRSGARG